MFIQVHVTLEELSEMNLSPSGLVNKIIDDLDSADVEYIDFNVEVNICEE